MAVIQDPNLAGNLLRVGEAPGVNSAAHVTVKPIPSAIGHYRVTHRTVLVATQAALSRLFTVRNPGPNLLIPTSLQIKVLCVSAHTTPIENSIDVFKGLAFTVNDNTNVVLPTARAKRTTGMTTAPGQAEILGITIAGAAAGMTGGTMAALASPIASHPYVAAQAVMAATETVSRFPSTLEVFPDRTGEHPLVIEAEEGIVVANRALLGAAAGAFVYIDFSWAEVTDY